MTYDPNKPEIIINVGFPASGKSIYSINKICKDPDYIYINRDTLKTIKKWTFQHGFYQKLQSI